MQHQDLTGKIIGLAYKVHNTMGPGFLESVYENCLMIELKKAGIKAQSQHPVEVKYEGIVVGNFVADIVVEDSLIIELKAVLKTAIIHEVQLVNYLKATEIESGLLLNFGGNKVDVKRKYRDYKPKGWAKS